MSHRITEQTTDHSSDANGTIISYQANRLLVGSVPIDMMSTKPGLIAISKAPRRNRFAAMPVKLVHAGEQMSPIPQQIIVVEEGAQWADAVAGTRRGTERPDIQRRKLSLDQELGRASWKLTS